MSIITVALANWLFLWENMNNCMNIRILFFIECGVSPVVRLNCSDNGIVHVRWDVPDCLIGCSAYLLCDNGTTLYHEQVSLYKN